MCGNVNWNAGPEQNPVPNVSKTPLVGGQWTKTGDNFDLVITVNPQHPEIPTGGKTRLL
jgi:branched-chain amino acid transport system substrate-binding protein